MWGLIPVIPQNAAGWRMEPPVSVPEATGASPAATAAALPLELPPGARVSSQGLRVGPKCECSPEEPMANSSMFVFPSRGIPAAAHFSATAALYGAMKFSRKRDPQVVRAPLTQKMSLWATGIPRRGEGESGRSAEGGGGEWSGWSGMNALRRANFWIRRRKKSRSSVGEIWRACRACASWRSPAVSGLESGAVIR